MRKVYKIISVAALLTIGLAGCGSTDQGAMGSNQSDGALSMGYYSNENHGNGGNVRINEENDGPLVEIMDHTFGTEGNQIRQDTDGNVIRKNDQNIFNRQPGFRTSDVNYHGHLDQNNDGARSSYYTAYDGNLSKTIANAASKVKNVKDVRSVVKGNKVIVATILENNSDEQTTKRAIAKAVKRHLNGKSLTIVTDEATFSRIRTIDNSLRDGVPKDQVQQDINNMLRSVENRTNKNDS